MLTRDQIQEFAAEMIEQMTQSDRVSFARDSAGWRDGITTNYVIACDADGDHYIETDDEWGELVAAAVDALRDCGVIVECIECGAEVVEGGQHIGIDGYLADGVPTVDNNDAWAEIQQTHGRDCEWVRTRAWRLES